MFRCASQVSKFDVLVCDDDVVACFSHFVPDQMSVAMCGRRFRVCVCATLRFFNMLRHATWLHVAVRVVKCLSPCHEGFAFDRLVGM